MSDTRMKLRPIPITLEAANQFTGEYHRHHGKVVGCKWATGIVDEEGKLRGTVICGRPVAMNLNDGFTLEVNRLTTDGCPNACSALYAVSRRIAKEMGYHHIITYILDSEPGTSLIAAGWQFECFVKGQSWNRPSRTRVDKHPTVDKARYGCWLNK